MTYGKYRFTLVNRPKNTLHAQPETGEVLPRFGANHENQSKCNWIAGTWERKTAKETHAYFTWAICRSGEENVCRTTRKKTKAANWRRRRRVRKSFYPNCPQNMQKRKTNIAQGVEFKIIRERGCWDVCCYPRCVWVTSPSRTLRIRHMPTGHSLGQLAKRIESKMLPFSGLQKSPKGDIELPKEESGNVSEHTVIQTV